MSLLDDLLGRDRGLPGSAYETSGPVRIELVHGALLRLGLATDWRARDVDALAMWDYRNAAGHAMGADVSGTRFTRSDLLAVCESLAVPVDPGASSRDMRDLISRYMTFSYESPRGRVRGFREDELQEVAMRVIRAEHGGRR